MELHERLRQTRQDLHLSQEYVAHAIGINRTSFINMECGTRRVSAQELAKLSVLYGVSSDRLLGIGQDENRKKEHIPAMQKLDELMEDFGQLSETDRNEILDMVKFKKWQKEGMEK